MNAGVSFVLLGMGLAGVSSQAEKREDITSHQSSAPRFGIMVLASIRLIG